MENLHIVTIKSTKEKLAYAREMLKEARHYNFNVELWVRIVNSLSRKRRP
jgi:hypothetical protein